MSIPYTLTVLGSLEQRTILLVSETFDAIPGNQELVLTTLHEFTVPADTLAVDEDSLEFEYRGAASGDNVDIRVTFGANMLVVSKTAVSASGTWVARGRVIRKAVAEQKGGGEMFSDDTDLNAVIGSVPGTEDLAADVVMKIEAVGDAANDVELHSVRLTLHCARP